MTVVLAIVSQFTLLASAKKGNKPDFHKSAGATLAKELYDKFFAKVQTLYREDRVKNGVFQAMMDVGLVNDGPVGVDYCCLDEAVNALACSLRQRVPYDNADQSRPGHYYHRHRPSAYDRSFWVFSARGWGYFQRQGAEAIYLASITLGIDCRIALSQHGRPELFIATTAE